MTYQLAADPTVFRAISDPTRRAILSLLRSEARPVHAIAEGFEVSRPAISQHLKVLLDAGLVREKKDGRNRIYALEATPLSAVDEWLAAYRGAWETNLLGLKQYVEGRTARPGRRRKRHGPRS